MDDLFKQQMEDFPALWERIYQREQSGKNASDEEKLDEDSVFKELINEAHCSAVFYGNLAKMFQNPGRGILLSHAQDCRNRCRMLRAEYFILSGISYQPDGKCQGISGKNAALRTAMLNAENQAKKYRGYSEIVCSEALHRLCQAYCEECERHKNEDRMLLLECF